MLEFKRLNIKNFGPFKGEQGIEFPKNHGVSIVYGQNMRGKTSLLNAVRYALYGKITTRGSKSLDFHNVINTEAAELGDYEFSVALTFEFEGHDYELTRLARPTDTSKKPEKHDDYEQTHFLKKDGIVLSQAQRDLVLEQIMPEQVSRFFLFDGELLQEYEELVIEESETGRKIKNSIERILGLPLLTNSRADMENLKQEAQTIEAKTAQTDKSTREIGTLLTVKNEERKIQAEELKRLKKDLKEKQIEKQQLASDLKKNERALTLLDEKQTIEGEIQNLMQKKADKYEKIKTIMSDSWQWLLNPKLEELIYENNEELDELQKKQARQSVSDEITASLTKAISDRTCPTCDQAINESTLNALKERLSKYDFGFSSDDQKRLDQLISLRTKTKEIVTESNKNIALELLNSIAETRLDIAVKQDDIKEINKQAEGIDEEETRNVYKEHEKTLKDISILEKGIEKQEEEVIKVNRDIENLSKRLTELGGKNIKKDTYRRELCDSLYQLFDSGVDKYRDKLRKEIEKDATYLFLNLTTEPDYAGLKINANYGLTIVHKDGHDVLVRSAGAEHIVALSLMGALQKNAPFRGPIVMDSLFTRLDDQHTPRVVRSLPLMAKQVVLLVFARELDPQMARNELKTNLSTEYQLTRRSASYSEIEKYIG